MRQAWRDLDDSREFGARLSSLLLFSKSAPDRNGGQGCERIGIATININTSAVVFVVVERGGDGRHCATVVSIDGIARRKTRLSNTCSHTYSQIIGCVELWALRLSVYLLDGRVSFDTA